MKERFKEMKSLYKFEHSAWGKGKQLAKAAELSFLSYTIGGAKSAKGAISFGPFLSLQEFVYVLEYVINGAYQYCHDNDEDLVKDHMVSKKLHKRTEKAVRLWIEGCADIAIGIGANLSPVLEPGISLVNQFCIKPNK